MQQMTEMATEAATRTVGRVTSVRHTKTLDAGEQVFHVVCHEHPHPTRRTSTFARKVVVTLNPNGHKATVEWPAGANRMNYKVCDLRHLTTTREEKAIRE